MTEQLIYKRLDLTSEDMGIDPNMETMWFELYPAKSRQLLIGIFYRPPSYNQSTFSNNFESLLTTLSRDGIKTIVMGDFNYDFGKISSLNSSTKHFQRITRLFGLKQLIVKPTRIT